MTRPSETGETTSSQRVHSEAVIISSGDEIIVGQLLDTNSQYLADQLVSVGILPVSHISIPDDRAIITETLRKACAQAPLVVLSGGLGPTEGDLTRHALADLLGDELVLDTEADLAITTMLARRQRPMTDRQRRQALRPARATCLPNSVGTAPGLFAQFNDSDIICLPGPPGELKPMWISSVQSRLRPRPGRTVLTRLLHIVGIPEAECVGMLGDLTKRDRSPLVGITASGGILTLRIRFDDVASTSEAERSIDDIEKLVRETLGHHVFAKGTGAGTSQMPRRVLEMLTSSQQTLGLAESCTGGQIGQMLTSVPGASTALLGGYICYSNELKVAIGVPADVIGREGAVSAATAAALSNVARRMTGATFGLSVTGIAGPDGGSDAKPVGTVFISLATPSSVDTRRFHFTGGREDIRTRASMSALTMLYFHLSDSSRPAPKLLWQLSE